MTPAPSPLRLEFCGTWTDVDPSSVFTVGREGDLVVDTNPYLHRRFLEIEHRDGMWWLANVGRQIATTVSDRGGRFQAWLAPGARLPLAFREMSVRFSAGPTTYGFALHVKAAPFAVNELDQPAGSATTLGRVPIEGEHRLLVLALAEPVLRSPSEGRITLPTSAAAAARLGWPITKFNRKLDHLCQKLKRAGVAGLHGDVASLAVDRRTRLVEYALAARVVAPSDLAILEQRISG